MSYVTQYSIINVFLDKLASVDLSVTPKNDGDAQMLYMDVCIYLSAKIDIYMFMWSNSSWYKSQFWYWFQAETDIFNLNII